MRRLLAIAPMLILLDLVPSPTPAQEEPTCKDLMRRVKLASLDQEWDRARQAADLLLSSYPDCPHRQQASFIRAQSLDRAERSDAALSAYSSFVGEYCTTAADSIDCDLARITMYDIAGTLHERTKKDEYLDVLRKGLQQAGDPGIFAALTLADSSDAELRQLALPHLLEAYESRVDAEVEDRICLAILRIDRNSYPCGKTKDVDSGEGPSLISVEVFDKTANQTELRLNMPVALAEAVIKALPDAVYEEMVREGIDAQMVFQAIRERSKGTIFQVETPEMKIRIWLQ